MMVFIVTIKSSIGEPFGHSCSSVKWVCATRAVADYLILEHAKKWPHTGYVYEVIEFKVEGG